MTSPTLSRMLQDGENFTVEFKSDRGPLEDSELLSTVVCLANAQGGFLLVGVENDGAVTGLHNNRRNSRPELLAAYIASRTVPPLTISVTFEVVEAVGKQVAVLHVPSRMGSTPIATSDGRLLIRYLDAHGQPGCRPLYPHELSSWQADRGQIDITAQPVLETTWNDLDPLEFVRLRGMIDRYRGDVTLLNLSDTELARALGLCVVNENKLIPTLAGLLLTGHENALRTHVPSHEVAFQVLRDTDVLVNEFYHSPLLRILERILEAFQVRNEERELNIGLFRVGIPAYDPRGFREALNNALVHRDYNRLGTVHVQLHEDRLNMSNPGGFVQGVRPDNLLVVDPNPRNPRLVDCFKRIGLVERTGRGVSIIYNGQLRNGRPAPSYERTTEVNVMVTLYGGPAALDFVQLILTEESRQNRSLNVSELLVLDHVYRERDIDLSTASSLTQRPETEVRSTLERLVEAGLVERRGSGRTRTYHLSASIYRELGHPEAYVHAHGFETLQMEQMILQYVQAHERITRDNVITLCRVEEHQAYYLLKKLAERGELKLVGRGRSSYYIPAYNAE
jgi:ATP-dependent DNA helicase RecG